MGEEGNVVFAGLTILVLVLINMVIRLRKFN